MIFAAEMIGSIFAVGALSLLFSYKRRRRQPPMGFQDKFTYVLVSSLVAMAIVYIGGSQPVWHYGLAGVIIATVLIIGSKDAKDPSTAKVTEVSALNVVKDEKPKPSNRFWDWGCYALIILILVIGALFT